MSRPSVCPTTSAALPPTLAPALRRRSHPLLGLGASLLLAGGFLVGASQAIAQALN